MSPSLLLRSRAAVCAIFVCHGVMFATWVSRIPAIRDGLRLSESELGLALLAVAVGALVSFPISGWAIARFGSRRVVIISLLGIGASLVAVSFANSYLALWLALMGMGMGNGAGDVAMNAQAVEVEVRYGRSIMSSFHATWNIGGLLGSFVGSALVASGLTPSSHFLAVVAAVAVVIGLAGLFLLPIPGTARSGPIFARLPKSLMGVGLIIFCAALGEGAMSDWGAIYLRDVLKAEENIAALGYSAFSVAMLVGRLAGDFLVTRFGAMAVVAFGGTISAVGLGVALLVADPWVALVGFACVGWGIANGFPLAFSAAGNAKGSSPGAALAAMATIGYTAFLVGPPVIGFVAEAISLPAALSGIVVLTIIMAFASRSLRR